MNERLGVITGLAADAYHADPDSVSNTMLSAMNKSPAHCYALHLDPQRPIIESTDAMAAGTLAHTIILEPDTMATRYVVKPDNIDFRRTDGKAWKEAQTLPIIDCDAVTIAEQQRAAFLRVGELRALLHKGTPEASVFWRDATTGLRCRARPDWLHPTGPRRVKVLDVKTIRDLTPDAVQRAISTYGYHRQAAHYTAGLQACGVDVQEFVFGFVSASYPFLAAAFVLDEETMQQGRDEVAELLERFADCKARNDWPAFGDGCQLVTLPTWAKRSNAVELEIVQ